MIAPHMGCADIGGDLLGEIERFDEAAGAWRRYADLIQEWELIKESRERHVEFALGRATALERAANNEESAR